MQRHRQEGQNALPFGLIGHVTRLIPFQLYRPTGSISGSAALHVVSALDDTTTVAIASATLDQDNNDGGGFWVTFHDQGISETVTCGYWYLRLVVNGVSYYSDVLWLRNFPEVPKSSTIKWTSATDKGTVLYQDGYEQFFHSEPWVTWDIPDVDVDIDAQINGYGETVDTYARVEERIKFEIKNIPDYALATLSAIGFHDTVTLQLSRYSLLVATYTLTELRFTSRREGKELSTGVFTSIGRQEILTGCQPNFETE
jgi:hypothetical protein